MATTKTNPSKDIGPGQLPSTVTSVTAVTGDNDTSIATTAFVQQELNNNTVYFSNDFTGTGTLLDPINNSPTYFTNKFTGAGTLGDPIDLTVDPATKQDILVSGTNLKTINGNSLLGSGDLTISGGSGDPQSPWLSNIDANGYALSALSALEIAVPATFVYSTWNPSDKSATITLSGGNLLATSDGSVVDSVRSTIGKSSGKWYWEIELTTFVVDSMAIGIRTSAESLATLCGDTTGGFGYNEFGEKRTNAVDTSYGIALAPGDIVGVAMDLDVGTLSFLVNNSSQGVAFTGIPAATYYACYSSGFSTNEITANFGATGFTYTPPSGYIALANSSGGVDTLKTNTSGNTGFGITSPTAKVHLAAGTTSLAPFKFTSGTNLSTPEIGAVEWNGTNLFVTQTTGPTRKTIAYTTDIPASLALGTIGATPNANAGTISGSTLTLQPASSTFGGVVTTAAQSFDGQKTFDSQVKVNKLAIGSASINGNIIDAISSGTSRFGLFTTDDPVALNGRVIHTAYYGTSEATSLGWRWGLNTSSNNTLDFTIDDVGYPSVGQFTNRFKIQKSTGFVAIGGDNATNIPTHPLTVIGGSKITGTAYFESLVGIQTNTPTSTFQSLGSFSLPIGTNTGGNYTMGGRDYTINCTVAITVTLPAASGKSGRIYVIKNSSAGTVTINVTGGDTIDGLSSQTLTVQYSAYTLQSDGTSSWAIIGKV